MNSNSRQRVKQLSHVQTAVDFNVVKSLFIHQFLSTTAWKVLYTMFRFMDLWGSDCQREGLVAKVSEHMDVSRVTTHSENLHRAEGEIF